MEKGNRRQMEGRENTCEEIRERVRERVRERDEWREGEIHVEK